MTQDRVRGSAGDGPAMGANRAAEFRGDRSSGWQGKQDPDKGRADIKAGKPKDTRRFADGRTR